MVGTMRAKVFFSHFNRTVCLLSFDVMFNFNSQLSDEEKETF